MEKENSLGNDTGGMGEPELPAEAWDSVDVGKQKNELLARKEKLERALDQDPSDSYATEELSRVTETLYNLENQPGSSQ
jgi:hypothetical protein